MNCSTVKSRILAGPTTSMEAKSQLTGRKSSRELIRPTLSLFQHSVAKTTTRGFIAAFFETIHIGARQCQVCNANATHITGFANVPAQAISLIAHASSHCTRTRHRTDASKHLKTRTITVDYNIICGGCLVASA